MRVWRQPAPWIALGVALCVGAFVFWRARGPRVPVAIVARRDIEQRLVSTGRVRVPARVQIASASGGLVIVVGVVEGQRVRTGDLLLQTDDAEARAQVARAKAAVDQAEARVARLRNVGAIVASRTLDESESRLAQAKDELARAEKLTKSGAAPMAGLDDARRKLEIARAQYASASAEQIASEPMGADSRVAMSALLHSRAELAGAQARLDNTRVVARQDGVVLSRKVEPGDVVQPSETLLVIAADGQRELVIEPDERHLAWIAIGQEAKAAADAFPTKTFDAKVCYIAPSVDPARGSIEVRLAVSKPPAFLKPDMTVSVDLRVAEKKGALTVPSDAIRGAATAAPFIFALSDGRVEKRAVVLGIRGEGATEIVSGIEEGVWVARSAETRVSEGMRVRAFRSEP